MQDQLRGVGARMKGLQADISRHSHTLKSLSAHKAAAAQKALAAGKENQAIALPVRDDMLGSPSLIHWLIDQ